MSQSGKVMAWSMKTSPKTGKKYAYGFAVTPAGQTIYIPAKALGGRTKRLQVGGMLNFDVEKVEGHDGRLLGTNVSGPAVVEWEDWKASADQTKDLAMQTKEEWAAHKESQSGWQRREATGAGPEKRKDTDGKFYTKQEFKDQYGGFKEWDKAPRQQQRPAAGRAAGRGAGQVEKRKDTDGRFYTKAEFVKEYGGYTEWDAAAPGGGRGGRGRGR
eukprot:TRINITY_DN488_c0_g1_i12.p2 TRINITY_DN488_c0_g1~~TRINITY_DN488_c0_g1_i12.p2  ORF type:complete len:248 (+),score=107.30 TRINITY_DN488_c0_g1_i12:102-746(+)